MADGATAAGPRPVRPLAAATSNSERFSTALIGLATLAPRCSSISQHSKSAASAAAFSSREVSCSGSRIRSELGRGKHPAPLPRPFSPSFVALQDWCCNSSARVDLARVSGAQRTSRPIDEVIDHGGRLAGRELLAARGRGCRPQGLVVLRGSGGETRALFFADVPQALGGLRILCLPARIAALPIDEVAAVEVGDVGGIGKPHQCLCALFHASR
jgi:hypothetical protein